jgi:cation transport regulator ChaB
MPGKKELPDTLKRSPKKAQHTWIATHDSAVEQYGEGERAHRTAFASLKHSYEKVGNRWEPKDERGPSDPQSARTDRAKRDHPSETFGGVDVIGHTRQELYERAAKLDVTGRSRMNKTELARAIERYQRYQ